jgi:hypothetical protein
MRTFSQYAATRLLREHPARTLVFGGVAVKAGAIQTFAGVDLITGMPVLIYTLPERPAPIPEVYSEFIPAILETGFEHELGYVVAASAPGYAPLKPTLSQPRLEWLATASASALADAHLGGLHHGNLEPAHFLVSGDHLMLEGWGLPWGDAQEEYRAPEGETSAASDVFAWARSLQLLGRGNPRLMLTGEMGRWIAHGLNPKPQDRPTAQEMVMALEKLLQREGKAQSQAPQSQGLQSQGLVKTLDARTLEGRSLESRVAAASETRNNEPTDTERKLKALEAEISKELPPLAESAAPITLEPSTVLEPPMPAAPPLEEAEEELPTRDETTEPRAATLEPPLFQAEPAVLNEPEHLAADEPDVQVRPVRESEIDPEAPELGLIVRREQNPIRIGFEQDDDSWRQVVRPDDANIGRGAERTNLWVVGVLGVLALACVIGLFLLLTRPRGDTPVGVTTLNVPGDPVSGSVVNFKLKPDSAAQGRLTVVSAPSAAKLEVGSVLASVPGPVLFKTPGAYRLRVSVDGYQPAEFDVNVPGQTEIVLELRQR